MSGIVEERGRYYGDPRPNMERTAALWSAYLGTPVTAHDASMMMTLVKVSRSKVDPSYVDNYVDAVGYLEIARTLG